MTTSATPTSAASPSRKARGRAASLLALLLAAVLSAACSRQPEHLTTEVLLPFTPVKNQGTSQTCWAYAMLSAIETEHICRGDSIHLSVAFIARAVEKEAGAPSTKRGMGITTVNMMMKHGIVPFDAMPDDSLPMPRFAFMAGCEYTPQEFARSVCAPGEYVGLGTSAEHTYFEHYEPPLKDNWEHNRLLNLPPDSLLAVVVRAVRQRHGVCWEGDISERGFDRESAIADLWIVNGSTSDDHCMAIVGIAHDETGKRYFIMKNSWGCNYGPFGGLVFLSFDYFRKKTRAVFLPTAALGCQHSTASTGQSHPLPGGCWGFAPTKVGVCSDLTMSLLRPNYEFAPTKVGVCSDQSGSLPGGNRQGSPG